MDYNNQIDQLIEKYWRGETTLQEEQWLRKEAPGQMLEDGLGAESKYFQSLEDFGRAKTALQFEALMARMGEEVSRPKMEVIHKQDDAVLGNTAMRRRMPLKKWMSSAAAVLLLIAASWYIMKPAVGEMQNDQVAQIEDPEQALQEVRQALMLVSSKLNSTTSNAAQQISRAEPYTEIFK